MTDVSAVDVYWRPGCLFCAALRAGLRLAGVPTRQHNIWEDESAAAFVRTVTGGAETVPTVAVGERAMVNPSVKRVVAELEDRAPDSVAVTRRRWLRPGRRSPGARARRGG